MATNGSPMPIPKPKRPASSGSPSSSSSITRGATARSAASPRVSSLYSPATRRPASRPPVTLPVSNTESSESLSASLKHEVDHNEQLLVSLQNKEQSISALTAENDALTSALAAAETRLNELYADQSRAEIDLAQRVDISEKLRSQVRELEKEKRDLQRRYNEQTATFEAERQSFYDNEQHLKSRIQSLMQARREPLTPHTAESFPESDPEDEQEQPKSPHHVDSPKPSFNDNLNDPDTEPAEMTALKLELSTLSTSYASLQSTLLLLQSQLVDLKRVNRELQEENESYMILLREKTLSGQFDLMKQVGGASAASDDDGTDQDDLGSLHSVGRSTLERVDEEPTEDFHLSEAGDDFDSTYSDPRPARINSREPSRHGRKRTTSQTSMTRGESLAGLPISGPGLDLAAELGRAENKDMLVNEGDERDLFIPAARKNNKKSSDTRKASLESGTDVLHSPNDIDALRTEVKSLKDANKALSLYASKIIDRIIAQEGFEHVLAVDYDNEPATPSTAVPNKTVPSVVSKPRPQSVIVGRPNNVTAESSPLPSTPTSSSNHGASGRKAQRRSLSFDWKNFSLFGGQEKKVEPNLRQLTLKPGGSPVTGARKLDTQEDEDDRKERERLNATMKLMGIQPTNQQSPMMPPTTQEPGAFDSPATPVAGGARRFSLFGGRANALNSDTSSINSLPSNEGHSSLTHEALEHAEAESSLAALDARERNLRAELARGGGSGFTELAPRISRRSRRSTGGSGSGGTVWSAGMSAEGEEH